MIQDPTSPVAIDEPAAADEPIARAAVDEPAADVPETSERIFSDLGLRPELLEALASLGYEEPTPIQAEAIPPLLEGRDLLGQAATGTGKTAAFALPLLNRLSPNRGRSPSALVLAPTRELAVQVSEATHKYGRRIGARVLPVYGGQPIGRQLRELERGVDIVVATPGRALDHLQRGSLDLSALTTVVLDEADEMLDMGFADELDAILDQLPEQRQTVLFSATMAPRVERIARRRLNNPIRIEIRREAVATGDMPRIRQTAYVVPRMSKPTALGRVLDLESPTAAIIFCRTREEVDSLSETLNGRGYRAEALHGGLSQEQRDKVMGRLRSGTADLLVATDVAARGLDVDQLTHVVNYNVPSAPDAYVHRIGRVGRAGREGVAITLAEPREHRMLKTIERVTGVRIAVAKVPTVADLRTRKLELTRAALRESLLAEADTEALEQMRPVIEALSDEFDIVEVALAAVKLAHEATTTVPDEEDIPEVTVRPERRDGPAGGGSGDSGRRGESGPRGGRSAARNPDAARLFIGVGRAAGVRPQDLVGAIAGETRLTGRDVGAIEIFDKFSLVDVPQQAADEVITSLRSATLRGRKATVRLDHGHSGDDDGPPSRGGDAGRGGSSGADRPARYDAKRGSSRPAAGYAERPPQKDRYRKRPV
ncbi:MAG: ATP-dependent helicase DeaD [Frankiaceae bacterium]|jgi:ATP-dependent RNA helicase DeaD|nr:ATP-dependent helicase DeaD [Frankiaceae bacterium]